MANMMKFTKMEAMAVIAHQERTCLTHSNDNIDPEQTQYNYSVWPYDNPDLVGEKHGWARLTKRLSQVKCLRRSDVNVLVEWTIHLGTDVPPGYDNEEEFFRACMRYCENKYGSENIIYGIVHVDEETPHLTVGIVPVVKKKLKLRKNESERLKQEYEEAVAAGKTIEERVDANAVINRKHLQGWHGGLTQHLIDELGYDPAVYTGITEELGGNMTVEQLKRQGSDWRERRNKRAAAFHEARRAKLEGRRPSVEAVMELSKTDKPQAELQTREQAGERAESIDDIIKKSGGPVW